MHTCPLNQQMNKPGYGSINVRYYNLLRVIPQVQSTLSNTSTLHMAHAPSHRVL